MEKNINKNVPTGCTHQAAKTIFQVNHNAVCALQVGDYAAAISHLQHAMTWIRDVVHDPAQRGFTMVPIPGYGCQAEKEVFDYVSILSVPAFKFQEEFPSPNLDTTTPFPFFDGAIITPYLNYDGTGGLRLTCALILFNLGLCFHHREISNGTMNPEKLGIAIKFYERALRILQVEGAALSDGPLDGATVLLLALFSNMGSLLYRQGNDEECRDCYFGIQELLASPYTQQLAQSRADVAFFYQNFLFRLENTFFKAPAA